MVGCSLCRRPLAGHPTTPPFPYQHSTFLCSPCCFLPYTSFSTHTLQHHSSPTRSPTAGPKAANTHTQGHTNVKMKDLMLHGTFKEVTHMASLHARIPPYTLATLQLTATCIDIHIVPRHISHMHSLSCRDSLVNQT